MAVFTHVPRPEIERALAGYPIGALIDFKGAPDGIENTTYFLRTTAGRFVLTLFEKRANEADLPFFLALMRHLARKGFPAPLPVADLRGAEIGRLCGRPAAIFTFLPGAQRMNPSLADCAAFGRTLASLHAACADFNSTRENDLGLSGWRRLADACATRADELAPDLSALILDETAFLTANWPAELPSAAVHVDLFPDNVFFMGDDVSGVIDFYFSCTDFLAYDLAVTLNAWSSNAGRFDDDKASALLGAYEARRPLSFDEKTALPLLLRGAALRFLLTRLYDALHPQPNAIVRAKDPLEYRDVLLAHRSGVRIR